MSQENVYVSLAERLNRAKSRLLPQIFRELVTPQEARLLLALPATPQELANNFRLDENRTKEMLDELMVKGLAIPLIKEGVSRYFLVRSALQLHDSCLQYDAGDKVLGLWQQFRESEWYEICEEWGKMPLPAMRVLPLPSSIAKDTDKLLLEDMRATALKAETIAVVRCVCRTAMRRCSQPVEVCFVLDAGAEFALRRGTGRKIGVEEAYDIFERCAQEGLVPLAMNRAKLAHLCFCCADCCIFLQPYTQRGYNIVAPSRYQAVVDEGLCNGCQDCMERCQFDAIQMRRAASSRRLKAFILPEKCFGCGACTVKCHPSALAMKLVRPAGHIPETSGLY